MRNREISFTKSFRFKIIVYSLVSLFLTVLTEGIIAFLLKQLGLFSRYLNDGSIANISDTANGTTEARNSLNSNMSGNVNNNMNSSIDNSLNSGRNSNSLGGGSLNGPPDMGSPFNSIMGGYKVYILVIVALIAGVILFIIYFLLLSQRIYVSLAKIAAGVENMASGDLNTRIQIDGEDEFAVIGEKLNNMALDISMLMENERRNERVKNNLITNVAHDLRTPLTSVIGYLDLLVKNPDLETETKKKYMEIAYDKSKRLQKLIEDLFSYTKVSQGEVEPNLAPLDVVKFMEQMIDEFYPAFQEAGLEYEFLTNHSFIEIMADGDLLARAFSNLIGNAVKYGRDGKNIRVHMNSNKEEVTISVINYGKVIPEKDLEYIFERFYRVEGSRSEQTGGTGLGLAIAKRIIVMHGGTIKASSGMDGTVFEVVLKIITQKGEAYEEKGTSMVGSFDAL